MKILPVHQVERQWSLLDGEGMRWLEHLSPHSGGSTEKSTVAQSGCGAWAAPVPSPWGALGPGRDPSCPHSPPCSVFCRTINWSHSLETEHFLFSEQGHLPTFYIITKGEEYVLHLVHFFYT